MQYQVPNKKVSALQSEAAPVIFLRVKALALAAEIAANVKAASIAVAQAAKTAAALAAKSTSRAV